MERLIDAARAALGATRWSALLAEAAERDPGVALDRAVEELSELAPASLLD